MVKLYQTTKWRKARAGFIKDKQCDWNSAHDGPLTLDHTTYLNFDGSTMNDDQLLDFETLYTNGGLLVLCRKCASARRYKKGLCAECGVGYHADKNTRCFDCERKANPDQYVLCAECGEQYHNKGYSRCFLCNRKQKRSRAASKGWTTRRNQGRKK